MPPVSLTHWGAFEANVRDGRLVAARPWGAAGGDPAMIGTLPRLVHSPLRIDRPHVRRAYLERGPGAGGRGRGRDEMLPVAWDIALDLVADALSRTRAEHGPSAIFGGSYGWSSAGRFHHARTQVRRFLAAAGGFTDQIGNYSWGAADALLPHVLGSSDAVSSAATSWETIAETTDLMVAFGGLNPKNWRVTSGGAGAHAMPAQLGRAMARGMTLWVVSPQAGDVPPGIDAARIAPRPNTDTAILLALAHQALAEGVADRAFLERYTTGHAELAAYLRGDADGTAKTLAWAARIADVPEPQLAALWAAIRDGGRVMLTASWSLQRADHGEQSFWALIALAAMLGQIGLPGGGFCFGYGSMNAVGADARRGYVPSLPGLPNPAGSAIPAAAILDMLQHPGKTIRFNGRDIPYPDTRMIYWAGGNPFHHAQDLFALERAWQRPDTVVVHEPWWTPAARRADIVLPATTALERADIGGSSRDPHVFAMPQLIPPQGEARNDFAIFAALADRLGCRQAFDGGRDEEAWLRHLWQGTQERGRRDGVAVPDYDSFRAQGVWRVPPPDRPEVLLEDFRRDPEGARLKTPSGRIELRSQTIGARVPEMAPHPIWLPPQEYLGVAEADEFHLVTNQPARQLHSQLYQCAEAADRPQPVQIAPQDMARLQLAAGEIVRLWNRRGACLARVQPDPGLRPRVLIMATGAWYDPDPETPGLDRNGNPNVLTADRRTSPLGQACAALSTLVRLEKYTQR